MRTAALSLALVLALGCSKASPTSPEQPPTRPEVMPRSAIAIQIAAVTLADDCGTGPRTPPTPKPAAAAADAKRAPDSDSERQDSAAKSRRMCEQSSMQLAITSPADAKPSTLVVKSVELFDDTGASIGKLAWRTPSRWSGSQYETWDEAIAPSQELAVSYALASPAWSKVPDRWNRRFTLKAVLSIGGADQTLQQTVELKAPASLPPDVDT